MMVRKMEVKPQKFVFITILCWMMLILSSCKETDSIGEYQSITQIYNGCPGKCGEKLVCEGQLVKVWGYLDQHNVFDNSQSDLEIERFVIAGQLDAQGFGDGKVIEVYPPQERNNAGLFDKLNEFEGSSKILVAGTIKGFDAPTNFTCERLISLEIQGEEDVNIE